MMRTSADEELRQAAYLGLRNIGPPLLKEFCCIVNNRNRLAKMLGYCDYYEYKLQTTEGVSKEFVFDILEEIETRTRQAFQSFLDEFATKNGANSIQPWNLVYYSSGDITTELDPYFNFRNSIRIWLNCFSSMGVNYRGSKINMDLLDRQGKYNNGFCHWPMVAHFSNGVFYPSAANLTSLATPNQIGAGYNALHTLLHECGHAASFANCIVDSPMFSQERAPFSVINAETTSMFFDSLQEDADFMAQYAVNSSGESVPFALLERFYRAKQPEKLLRLRQMLIVPFFERALYELAESDVTPEKVANLADQIEKQILIKIQSPRPLLSVPHILSWESSAYYHAYVLAQCAVDMTRNKFMDDGSILNNFNVGSDLFHYYWRWGCTRNFFELVKEFTGQELSPNALIADTLAPIDEVISQARRCYDSNLWRKNSWKDRIPDLGLQFKVSHGTETICDTEMTTLEEAVKSFEKWIDGM
ncbi:hypothetical protein RCL1_001197 [Eukaryota sp. TZLM3-RCL]